METKTETRRVPQTKVGDPMRNYFRRLFDQAFERLERQGKVERVVDATGETCWRKVGQW